MRILDHGAASRENGGNHMCRNGRQTTPCSFKLVGFYTLKGKKNEIYTCQHDGCGLVYGTNQKLAAFLADLERRDADVVLLQETKVS